MTSARPPLGSEHSGRGCRGGSLHLGCHFATSRGCCHLEQAMRVHLSPARRHCPGTGSVQVQTPRLSVGGVLIVGSAGKAARGGVGRIAAWLMPDEVLGEHWASGGRRSRNLAWGEPRSRREAREKGRLSHPGGPRARPGCCYYGGGGSWELELPRWHPASQPQPLCCTSSRQVYL